MKLPDSIYLFVQPTIQTRLGHPLDLNPVRHRDASVFCARAAGKAVRA